MKINYKAWTAGAILAAAVITPISLTINSSKNSYKTDPYKVTIANGGSIQTLNKFKSSSIATPNSVLGMWNAALIKARPSGDNNGGLETSLSIPKLLFNTSGSSVIDTNGDVSQQKLSDFFSKITGTTTRGYGFEGFTPDLATSTIIAGTSPYNADAIGFNLRDTRFWNGDKLTAEDFIETVKIALNVKNAVPWVWNITGNIGIKNAKKIVDAQNRDGLSFEEALKKYPLGIYASEEIPLDDLATSDEGKEYFRKEYDEGRRRHSKIVYAFEGSKAFNFLRFQSLGTLCTPTSVRHFKKVGVDNWGTKIDNLMGIGPYKLEYFDLDYKIVSNRWTGYWDYNKTISPQIEIRVLPEVSSQIQMFREGTVGKVSFGTAMLPQFLGDPNLKKFVKPTNWAENLYYLASNTKPGRQNSKYLLDSDFRNAMQYAVDRNQYLAAIAADNSYPAEGFSTLSQMSDSSGQGVINNAMTFNNSIGEVDTAAYPSGTHISEWNKLYDLPGTTGPDDLFTRDEYILKSPDISRNDKTDHLHNENMAKAYFDRFKHNHPEFNGVSLSFLVAAGMREQVSTIKQDVEELMPGVSININSKPDNIESQIAGGMNWDLRFSTWSRDYEDLWTFYHLLSDKINVDKSTDDEINRSRINKSAVSDGFTLIDYAGHRLTEDPTYFARHYFNTSDPAKVAEINKIIAQWLKMEATIGSTDPRDGTNAIYDEAIWTKVPNESNGYEGYGGDAFTKFTPYYPHANQWANTLKNFIAQHGQEDNWKNIDYRYSVLYPFIEKLIRESAIGTPISRVQNNYIASRFIGEANFAGMIRYFGWIYQADHIPPSRFPLPGIEAITK